MATRDLITLGVGPSGSVPQILLMGVTPAVEGLPDVSEPFVHNFDNLVERIRDLLLVIEAAG